MKKYISIALVAFIFTNNIAAQNIEDSESLKNILKEDFSDKQTNFPILTTVDNYFIIDNGDYLLSRNNTESEYAILASTEQNISDFSLKTAIKLGPSSNKRSSAGVIIKAQTNGTGALVFELNKKGEYRIKELLITKTYKYLSGKTSNEGWVKNREIKGQDEFNAIHIKCKENVYDIYVNNKFITTLYTPSLNSGKMGIIIGRDAKARIAYYYLDIPTKTTNNLIEEHMNDFTVVNLSNRVKELESENLTLQNTNVRLNKENKSLKNDNSLKTTIDELQKSETKVDSLNVIITVNEVYLKNTVEHLAEERENIKALNIELSENNKTIQEFTTNKKNYISKISNLKEDISSLETNLEATNYLLTEERRNLTNINSELERGNKMISEFHTTRTEFTTKISVLTDEITNLSDKINSLNTEVTSTKNRLESQKELNKDLNNTNKKITEEKLVLNNTLNSTKSNLNNKGTELNSLKTKNTSLSTEIKNINTEISSLKNKLNSAEKTEYSLNTKINSLKTELSTLEGKLNKQRSYSTKNTNTLKKEISEKETEITTLTSQLSETEKEISTLKNKYQSHATLENANNELKASLSEKETNINTLSEKVKHLKTKVEELTSTNQYLNKSETDKSEKISLLTTTVDELYTKVENMKKVLIYKGFDQSGIDSETVTTTKVENKKNTTTTTNKKSENKNQNISTNDNVTYTVQIATYGAKVTLNQFRGLKDVFYIDSENGTYLYMSGKFEDSNQAIEHRNKLVKAGYENAFIVKLNNK